MKNIWIACAAAALFTVGFAGVGCGPQDTASTPESASAPTAPPQHVSNIPPLDATNIVSIAVGSEDHTTLVAALEAADYVTSVAASGPLTVFAPTNAAFDALPAGTVESLVQPENADQLREILKYHVTTSGLRIESFRDGQTLGMANGAKAVMHVDGDTVSINDAKILASIPASNGMVHVVDHVLLPPTE
jgi:uncharacterized surface protein with fasciclin (FAS1) repeats